MRIGSLCSGYGGLDLAVQAVFADSEVAWFADRACGSVAYGAGEHESGPSSEPGVCGVDDGPGARLGYRARFET
jgi:hypothetical protein